MVHALGDLPPHRVVLFDTNPSQLASIAGDALPPRYRQRLRQFRHGAAAFKIDYALDSPVPWTSEVCRRAGTVHAIGTFAEIVKAEAEVARGQMPERPFVLVVQPSIFDPSRAPAGKHTLWVYGHVPHGYTGDATVAIEQQLERFAPGFASTVLARHVTSPSDLQQYNANYVGGDIAGGAHSGLQMVFRPTVAARPYVTPNPALFLCSASTPPGAGVHGMCGWHAADRALLALK
jgi:phytoene dehydrogenase-like protein